MKIVDLLKENKIEDTEISKKGFFEIDSNADEIAKYFKSNTSKIEKLSKLFKYQIWSESFGWDMQKIKRYGDIWSACIVNGKFYFVALTRLLESVKKGIYTSNYSEDSILVNLEFLELLLEMREAKIFDRLKKDLKKLQDSNFMVKGQTSEYLESSLSSGSEFSKLFKREGAFYKNLDSSSCIESVLPKGRYKGVSLKIKGIETSSFREIFFTDISFENLEDVVRDLESLANKIPNVRSNKYASKSEAINDILDFYKRKSFTL